MQYLIYLNNGELRAHNTTSLAELETFKATIADSDVLFFNGTSYPENVTPEIADILPVFVKTIQRQWDGRVTFLAPKQPPAPEVVVEAPVAAPKPRKPRKKKGEA